MPKQQPKKPSKPTRFAAAAKPRPVLVTTAHRGVFFGFTTNDRERPLPLERARLCLTWSADMQGFMGLATMGPSSGCNIGPTAPRILLEGVTSVVDVTPAAAVAWEAAKWRF